MKKISNILKYIFTTLALAAGLSVQAERAVFQVVAKETNEPMADVRGRVFDADSVFLSAVLSDAAGYIVFEDLKRGNGYTFDIGRDGKLEYMLRLPELTGDYDGGAVFLSLSHELEEVVVEGKPITQDARMMVAIPSAKEADMSMTTIDLLAFQNLPGLNVDVVNKTVSCYGGSVVFKVNGVTKSLDYIKAISPSKILKFEYHDNPTARYMGDNGVGGVINVVLKERLDGGTLFLYGSFCPWMPVSFTNGNVSGSYNIGKSQFEVFYNNDTRDYNKVKYDYERTYIAPSGDFRQEETVKSNDCLMRYTTNDVSASYTYYDKTKGLMGVVTLNTGFFKDNRTQDGEASIDGGDPFNRFQRTQSNKKNPTLDLYGRKEWSAQKTLEAQVVLSYSDMFYIRNFDEHQPGNPFSSETTTSGKFYGFTSEVNYSMPIGSVIFDAGVQESFSYSRNIYNGDQTARLNNNGTSANATLYWQHGGFSAAINGRGVYNHVNDRYRPTDYWRGIGSIQLNYNTAQGLSFNLYGNYSPITPTLSQLTTIVVDNNQNLTSTGNPDLKPAHPISARFRVGYNMQQFSAFLTVQEAYTKHQIVGTYRYLGNGQFQSTFENFDNCNSLGAFLNLWAGNLFEHLYLNLSGGYTYFRVERPGYRQSKGAWSVRGSANANFGAWSVAAYAMTSPRSLSPYRETYSNPESGLSVTYRWRHFHFGASAYCLYSKYKAYYYEYNITNPLMQEHFRQRMPQSYWMFALSVNYNINFGKTFQKSRKGLNNTIEDNSVIRAN